MKKSITLALCATGIALAGTGLNCYEVSEMKANEIEACVAQTDSILNADYKELMSDGLFKEFPQNKKALKSTQRAWLKFRDASCELILTLGSASSQKEEMMNVCLVKMTIKRNDELEELIHEYIEN